MNTFNKDFYPTPPEVVAYMLGGHDIFGKTIFEPSAGSGNIVEWLKNAGAKVIACEKHPDLAKIVQRKCDSFIGYDFLQVRSEDISHVNMIVANPPFSSDERHILHMWEIAPEGCEIISLCNSNTLKNDWTRSREKLRKIIEDHGSTDDLKNCFSDAERRTDVEISMVRLFKPRTNPETEFDGYFDLNEEEESQENGIMGYNEIRDYVNRYVGAVKMFDSVMDAANSINSLISPINIGIIHFGAFKRSSNDFVSIDRDTFKKELQKSAWKTIFSKMNMDKYVTKSLKEDINKFVEQQTAVPFTMKNVYRMIELIVGTHGDRMNKTIVQAFEKICSFSKDNSEAGEGWKTNSSYKINKNFIKGWMTRPSFYSGMDVRYDAEDELDDIIKALCFVTGKKYEDQMSIRVRVGYRYRLRDVKTGKFLTGYHSYSNKKEDVLSHQEALLKKGIETDFVDDGYCEWGKWYRWNDFFEIKGYKKGTMHFRFIDENVWYLFNKRVAEIKGWRLPSKTDTRTTGKERRKETGVEIF